MMAFILFSICLYFGLPIAYISGNTKLTIGVTEDWPLTQDPWTRCRHHPGLQIERVPAVTGDSVLQRAQNLRDAIDGKDYFALMGPVVDHVAMVAEEEHVPYLATDNSLAAAGDVYRLLPRPEDAIQCVRSLIDFYKWKDFGLLWEHQTIGSAMIDLLDATKLNIHTFRINSTSIVEIQDALRTLRRLSVRSVVVLTHPTTASVIVDTAMRLGIMANPYSWLIVHNGNWSDIEMKLEDIETNVTAVQLLHGQPDVVSMTTTSQVFAMVEYATSQGMSLICELLSASTETDLQLMDFGDLMNQAHTKGWDLPVQFDNEGHRVGFTWDIFTHNTIVFTKIAEWTKGMPGHPDILELMLTDSGKGHVWWMDEVNVVTILEAPWVMRRPDTPQDCQWGACYEGFIVDMMDHLADQFQPRLPYNLYIVPDGLFGSLDKDSGMWNGMMAEIISRNATMSLAPLSINKQREEAVDFTKPFKTRGISVLIRTPVSHASFFQFLAPLSDSVWIVILVALVVVSVVLGQFEKHGIPQRKDISRITERESCWFAFGSLVQEGTESTPLTVGGRILVGTWWFFAMILLSSYTANLAAFLTIKKINTPIETVSDLVGQTKISYGTVQDSGVLAFFQNTEIEPYRTMRTRMTPENNVASTEEGLQRVLQGNYAFLWDDTVLSYVAATNCNFTEIGPSFDTKGYGIGVPTSATYRENLTLAVLSLVDAGVIDRLEEKWWNVGDCPGARAADGGDTAEMQLENVAGIFFVLLGGLVLGLLACIFDKYVIPPILKITARKQGGPEIANNRRLTSAC